MKIALLFPGYGSQFVGMGKELYDEYRVVQEYFEEAANCLNVNFVKLCFATSDTELSKMSNAYTATFLVSCSIAALLKEQGLQPSMAAGYNFGELAAIHTAGGISLPDGLYLLNKFAVFYQESLETMDVAAIHVTGMSSQELQALCTKINTVHSRVDIAIYTTENDHIVTGTREAINALIEQLRGMSVVTYDESPIEIGLHSELMEPVAKQMRMYAEKVDFKNCVFPIVSTTDAQVIEQGADIKECTLKHIESPVRWPLVIDMLADIDLCIEVGPGSKLIGMVKEKYPDKLMISINKIADLADLKKLIEPSQESKDDIHGNI